MRISAVETMLGESMLLNKRPQGSKDSLFPLGIYITFSNSHQEAKMSLIADSRDCPSKEMRMKLHWVWCPLPNSFLQYCPYSLDTFK